MGTVNALDSALRELDHVNPMLNWESPWQVNHQSIAGLAIGTWSSMLSKLRRDLPAPLPSSDNLGGLILHCVGFVLDTKLNRAFHEVPPLDQDEWGGKPEPDWVKRSVEALVGGTELPEPKGVGWKQVRDQVFGVWGLKVSELHIWRNRVEAERTAANKAKKGQDGGRTSHAVAPGAPALVSAPAPAIATAQTTPRDQARALLLKERIENRPATHGQLTKLLEGEAARPLRTALAAQLAPNKEKKPASAAQLTVRYLEIPPLDVPKKVSQAYAGLTNSDKRQLREWVRYLLPELAVEVTRRAAAFPTDPPHAGLLVAPGVSYAFAACLNAALTGRPVSLHSSGSRGALDAPGRMPVKVDRIGAGGLAREIAESENRRIFADGALDVLAPDLVDTVTNWHELISACEVHNDGWLDSDSNPLHMVFRPEDGVGHDWLLSFVSELPTDLGVDVIHLKNLSHDIRLFEQQLTRMKPLFQDSPE